MNKIQIKNITKKYNNLTALDDVSFSFEFGKIYGLLGRNGAGKSTLINIIANRIFADEGMILVDDIPAKENMQVHEKVFCMSEADLYDKDLKIKEHFRWINRFYDCFDLNKALTILYICLDLFIQLRLFYLMFSDRASTHRTVE